MVFRPVTHSYLDMVSNDVGLYISILELHAGEELHLHEGVHALHGEYHGHVMFNRGHLRS